GRKPEYSEETPEARGEHANSTHTAKAGIEPPTLEPSPLAERYSFTSDPTRAAWVSFPGRKPTQLLRG
ncbi:hypothetical protein QTP70_017895, partial [Hemibagrus guttatus]